jgi:predicted RNA methylase
MRSYTIYLKIGQLVDINLIVWNNPCEVIKLEKNNLFNDGFITVDDASEILSVSTATIRNWLKSGILSAVTESKKLKLHKEEVLRLQTSIKNGSSSRLKSRRNKSSSLGNYVSKKYISSKEGYLVVSKIIEGIDGREISDLDIRVILAEYATKLYHSKVLNLNKEGLFLTNKTPNNDYNLLLEYLLSGELDYKYVTANIEILKFKVEYESEDFLGLLYMALQSLKVRKSGGVYYTPSKIVDKMVSELKNNNDLKDKHVIDLCCGTGNFLIALMKNDINEEYLHGHDIDSISVALARINLWLLSKTKKIDLIIKNITQTDSLKLRLDEKYDFCIGNPPWGSDIDFNDFSMLEEFESAIGRSVDSFALFLEKGIKILKKGGVLSYVVPESLTNVMIHLPIRQFIENNCSIQTVIFWGNAFDGVQSPSITITLKNNKVDDFLSGATIYSNNTIFEINQKRSGNSDIWSFQISDSENSIFTKLENSQTFTLKGKSKFALGIVTGDNKKFLDSNPKPNYVPILRGSDIYKFKHLEPSSFILYKPEDWQQVAQESLYFSEEKLFYRFISDTLVFAYDNKKTLSLNSANIIIPDVHGYSVKYIMAVLNSRIAHFYFKKKFQSVKVLRNHIESIPIPHIGDEDQTKIVSLVDKLLGSKTNEETSAIYNLLDREIIKIYGLSKEDGDIVTSFNQNNLFLF